MNKKKKDANRQSQLPTIPLFLYFVCFEILRSNGAAGRKSGIVRTNAPLRENGQLRGIENQMLAAFKGEDSGVVTLSGAGLGPKVVAVTVISVSLLEALEVVAAEVKETPVPPVDAPQ